MPKKTPTRIEYKSLRDLFDKIEGDEHKTYFLQTKEGSPFQNLTFMGLSFERHRGKYDKTLGVMTFTPGIIHETSPRLIEELLERAKEVFYRIRFRYDADGNQIPVRVLRRHDVRAKGGHLLKRRDAVKYCPRTGRVLEAWRPVSEFITIREVSDGGALTTEEALRAEVRDLRTQLADVEKMRDDS